MIGLPPCEGQGQDREVVQSTLPVRQVEEGNWLVGIRSLWFLCQTDCQSLRPVAQFILRSAGHTAVLATTEEPCPPYVRCSLLCQTGLRRTTLC